MAVVAVLTVDLVANTASFSGDLGNAAKSAEDFGASAADAGKATDFSMLEARGSVMLLGREFGVAMPREISRMIATIPGVGVALESLLPIMGAVFAVSMIYKWVEEHEKAAGEVQAAWEKSADTTRDVFDRLDNKLLDVGIATDELAGKHLDALNKQLTRIDRQTMSEIISELDRMGKSADDALAKMQSNWFMQMLMGKADTGPMREELRGMFAEIDQLKGSGADPALATKSLLGLDVDQVKREIDGIEAQMKELRATSASATDLGVINVSESQLKKLQQQKELYQQNLALLERARSAATESTQIGEGEKKNDTTKEANREAKDRADAAERADKLIVAAHKAMNQEMDQNDADVRKMEEFWLDSGLKAEQKAGDEKVKAAKKTVDDLQKVYTQQSRTVETLNKMEEEAEKSKARVIEEAENHIEGAVARSAAKSIVEAQSMASALRSVGLQITEDSIAAMLQWLERKIVIHEAAKLSDAVTAASNTMSEYPFPMNIPMAAAAFATTMAFEYGGEVPGSGAVPIMAHGGETVVTKALTDQVKGNTGSGGGHTFHMTNNISAVDAQGVERMLKKHSTIFQREVTSTLRKMNNG